NLNSKSIRPPHIACRHRAHAAHEAYSSSVAASLASLAHARRLPFARGTARPALLVPLGRGFPSLQCRPSRLSLHSLGLRPCTPTRHRPRAPRARVASTARSCHLRECHARHLRPSHSRCHPVRRALRPAPMRSNRLPHASVHRLDTEVVINPGESSDGMVEDLDMWLENMLDWSEQVTGTGGTSEAAGARSCAVEDLGTGVNGTRELTGECEKGAGALSVGSNREGGWDARTAGGDDAGRAGRAGEGNAGRSQSRVGVGVARTDAHARGARDERVTQAEGHLEYLEGLERSSTLDELEYLEELHERKGTEERRAKEAEEAKVTSHGDEGTLNFIILEDKGGLEEEGNDTEVVINPGESSDGM
ncbi:Unknown protein, partial [Striga hermonthica]